MSPAVFYVQNKMKKKISGLLVTFSVRSLMLTQFPFSLSVQKPFLYIATFNFSSLYLPVPRITLYIAAFNFTLNAFLIEFLLGSFVYSRFCFCPQTLSTCFVNFISISFVYSFFCFYLLYLVLLNFFLAALPMNI